MTRRATASIAESIVREQCRLLKLPTIAAQFEQMSADAARQGQTHTRYLEALFAAELDEREQRAVQRRLRDARFPRVKTLEEFDFTKSELVSAQRIGELSAGGYIDRGEPVVLIGECGTGKTHLATGLCVAAARQKRKVRFTTATGLINELVEAQHRQVLGRALQRWASYDLLAIDEVGYIPFAEVGAELWMCACGAKVHGRDAKCYVCQRDEFGFTSTDLNPDRAITLVRRRVEVLREIFNGPDSSSAAPRS